MKVNIKKILKSVDAQETSRKSSIKSGVIDLFDQGHNEEIYDIGYINGMRFVIDEIYERNRGFSDGTFLRSSEIELIAKENNK